MSIEELSEKYGSAALQVKEFARAQAQSAIATSRNALKEQLRAMDDIIDRYSVATAGYNEFGEAIQSSDPFINLKKDLGLVGRDLYEVFDAFTNLKAAMSFEEQQAALLQLDRALVDAGISAGELPPELNRALYEMRELVFQANELEASVMKAQGAVRNMTFGVSLLKLLPDSELLPPMPTPEDPASDREAAAKRLQAELDEVRNSLLTQEEAQIASYERQKETLQTALDQKLIKQKEYNALLEDAQKQHSDKMAEIDAYRYGSGLQQAQTFFGDMATAMAGGNDKMLKMSRTFGAAEALINAWRAYTQTIADPSLPFFAKIPAAISVLAAGMRAVSSIQSGSRGSAGGASSASAVAPSAAQATPGVSRNVAIQLTGGDMFSRSQVVQLINSINEAVEDGAVVRLV